MSSSETAGPAAAGNGLNTSLSPSGYSLLIVDAQKVVSSALRLLIDSWESFHVAGVADTVDEALTLVDQLHPDLVLVEICLGGKSGIELLYELRRRALHVKTVVLSTQRCEHSARYAVQAGASGYIPKTFSAEEFRGALLNVLQNGKYLPNGLEFLRELRVIDSVTVTRLDTCDPLSCLSTREREVFHMLAAGHQNSIIAKKLFISPRTVETHRARIVRKLGINSNAELIRYAIKHGLSTV